MNLVGEASSFFFQFCLVSGSVQTSAVNPPWAQSLLELGDQLSLEGPQVPIFSASTPPAAQWTSTLRGKEKKKTPVFVFYAPYTILGFRLPILRRVVSKLAVPEKCPFTQPRLTNVSPKSSHLRNISSPSRSTPTTANTYHLMTYTTY